MLIRKAQSSSILTNFNFCSLQHETKTIFQYVITTYQEKGTSAYERTIKICKLDTGVKSLSKRS